MAFNKIKILAPIDRFREVKALIKAGVDEFYCGIIINDKHFGTVRYAGDIRKYNVPNIHELEKIISVLKQHKKKLFIVFNLLGISKEKEIYSNIDRFKKIGVDGFIVTNVQLIKELRKRNLKIIASSLLETKNSETVKLLKKFKIQRVIFDRQITLHDIESIVPKFPGMEFEVFIMSAGCRSLDGYCHPRLAAVKKNGYVHPCFFNFTIRSKNKKNNSLTQKEKGIIAERLRMPRICCGACALYQLRNLNTITSVKIVGRGHETDAKVQNTVFIRRALNTLDKCWSQEEFYKKMFKLFRETFGKECNQRFCYYPHFFSEGN